MRGTAEYLLENLANGASGGMGWEGYDSIYHNNSNDGFRWSFWGLFAVNDTNTVAKTYTARKNFYTLSQITEFVRPGAQRIDVSDSGTLEYLLAFCNTNNGQFTLTGVNTNSSAANLSCALTSLPAIPSLNLYYTSSTTNLCYGGSVALTNDAFSVVVPADCVFTLTVVCPSVTLNPAALPSDTAGLSYSQSLGASGGAAPYAYSVMNGDLPPGITLSGGGVLAGTPTAVGNFRFTVQAGGSERLLGKPTGLGQPGGSNPGRKHPGADLRATGRPRASAEASAASHCRPGLGQRSPALAAASARDAADLSAPQKPPQALAQRWTPLAS